MDKKAQGISIDVIIIAAIALIVLVIIAVIFISKLGIFGSQVGDCANKGGMCVAADVQCGEEETAAEAYGIPMALSCPVKEEHCCVKAAA